MVWFLLPAAIGVTSFIAGALTRQPEINRLRKQVESLQSEITRLHKLIEEQNRQITEMKIRYTSLKAWEFSNRIKQMSYTRGAIIQQYAFKEYLNITVLLYKKKELSDAQKTFHAAFECFLNEKPIPEAEYDKMKAHIKKQYAYEIENMILPESENVLSALEDQDAA